MSLPDPNLHEPAKKLASAILTTAIERKHKFQSISLLKDEPEKLPSSACIHFKLTHSNHFKRCDAWNKLQEDIDKSTQEF